MNVLQKRFIEQKSWEIVQMRGQFGPMVEGWDNVKFMAIINDLEREIRCLKTQLAAKE